MNLEVSAGRSSLFFIHVVDKGMSEAPEIRIKEIAEPIIKQEDLFLVDVEIKHAKLLEVWILVDSETGGVNVDVCSKISREIGFIIDSEEIFGSAYRLNVSSPGLGRPLTDRRQFAKNVGRTAKVKVQNEDKYSTVEGILEDVNETELVLLTDKNERRVIDFDKLVETKIIPKI
ncbi:MAG: ribosome maturation factor [Balneolaceae bacterium]